MPGSGSESDGEPEVISFSRGKKNFQDEYEQQKKAADHKKILLKQKRQKLHKMLIEQKDSKLQRLDNKRLSTNVLDQLDSVVPDINLARKREERKSMVMEEKGETIKRRAIEKKVKRTKTTQFLITTVDKDRELTNQFQEKGDKFLRGCLFGKRTPRVPSKTLLMNKRKQVIGGHRGPPRK